MHEQLSQPLWSVRSACSPYRLLGPPIRCCQSRQRPKTRSRRKSSSQSASKTRSTRGSSCKPSRRPWRICAKHFPTSKSERRFSRATRSHAQPKQRRSTPLSRRAAFMPLHEHAWGRSTLRRAVIRSQRTPRNPRAPFFLCARTRPLKRLPTSGEKRWRQPIRRASTAGSSHSANCCSTPIVPNGSSATQSSRTTPYRIR